MIENIINKLLNKETISYLIFGILTTLVNLISYKFCRVSGINYEISTVIAWVLSVTFAYITNKFFVFKTKSLKKTLILKEITIFILSRLFSGLCDLGFMILAVEIFSIDDFIAKIFTNVFVVVINYIASKLFVFKER